VCSSAPRVDCVALQKGTLRVQEKKAGREKLVLGLKRFARDVTPASFGDPVTGTTAYRLCIYDDGPTAVATLLVDQAGAVCGATACWAQNAKGYRYGDRGAIADGVKRMTLRGGRTGRGKILVKARNKQAKQQTALPTGVAAALATTESATVQLVSDDASCFGATLSKVKRSTDMTFRAIER